MEVVVGEPLMLVALWLVVVVGVGLVEWGMRSRKLALFRLLHVFVVLA